MVNNFEDIALSEIKPILEQKLKKKLDRKKLSHLARTKQIKGVYKVGNLWCISKINAKNFIDTYRPFLQGQRGEDRKKRKRRIKKST